MSLHGLAEVTIGVPRISDVAPFYRDFGLNRGRGGAVLDH